MPINARHKVGEVGKEIQEAIKNIGVSLDSKEITISDKDLSQAMREAKVEPLPSDVWEKLPDFLKSAKSVYWDKEKPGIIYVVETEAGLGKFVVLPNYKTGKGSKATITNNVRTAKKIATKNEFNDKKNYTKLK